MNINLGIETGNLTPSYSNQTYKKLNSIVKHMHADVSLLGRRFIYADGHKGSVHIDHLPTMINNLVRQNPDFSENDRVKGRKIAKRINELYAESDSVLKTKNVITRILCIIRDWWTNSFPEGASLSIRTLWLTHTNQEAFEYYTYHQATAAFYRNPLNEASLYVSFLPPRWHISELRLSKGKGLK